MPDFLTYEVKISSLRSLYDVFADAPEYGPFEAAIGIVKENMELNMDRLCLCKNAG
jgi:hypothetical protein